MSTNTGLNGGGGPQVRAPGCPSQGVLNPMKISVCRGSRGDFEKIISKMSTNTGRWGSPIRAPGCPSQGVLNPMKSACVEPRGRVTGRKVLKKIRRENFEKIISKMSTNTGLNGGGGPQVRAPGCPSQGVLNPMKISVCRAEGKSNWQKSFKENSSGKFEKIISKMSTNTGLNGGGGPQVRAPGCPSQGVLNPMKISVCRAEGKSNWQKSFKENSSGKFWENYLQNVNKYGLKWRWGSPSSSPRVP